MPLTLNVEAGEGCCSSSLVGREVDMMLDMFWDWEVLGERMKACAEIWLSKEKSETKTLATQVG